MHLLTDGGKNSLFQSIEFVETTPCANLAESDKDTTHSLEIERLITTEYEHKSAQLKAKGLDGFCLARTGRTKGCSTELRFKSLRQCKITSVGEGGLDQAFGNTEVLPSIWERRIRYVDDQSIERVFYGAIKIEAHLI